MDRQYDLDQIWKRLFLIFALLLILSIALSIQANDFRFPILIFIAGNIGGYVGFHKSLSDLTDIEVHNLATSWFGIILPSFVGGILACLLYTVFLGGLLQGELFPNFLPNPSEPQSNPKGFDKIFAQEGTNYTDYAKMLFWSFVAGFNQKYVFDIVESIKGKNDQRETIEPETHTTDDPANDKK